jgi:hypothetical protein
MAARWNKAAKEVTKIATKRPARCVVTCFPQLRIVIGGVANALLMLSQWRVGRCELGANERDNTGFHCYSTIKFLSHSSRFQLPSFYRPIHFPHRVVGVAKQK